MSQGSAEEEILLETEERMEKAVEMLARELAGIRTGRASPALVEGLKVEAYETTMPLNQLAGISIPEPRLIVIQPWDRTVLPQIERALMRSDLGLTPSNDGNVIRLPIPELTEERRKDLVRLVRRQGEDGRVTIRHIRRDANDRLKAEEKAGDLSEDEYRRLATQVQELTDKFIKRVDEILTGKESEIMEE